MTAVHAYLADHKAATITRVIDAVKDFRATNHLDRVKVRLASGNAGVLAAINEEVSRSELPMMVYVYAAIALLVMIAYRDLRAVMGCCVRLRAGTFAGHWSMKELQPGWTMASGQTLC